MRLGKSSSYLPQSRHWVEEYVMKSLAAPTESAQQAIEFIAYLVSFLRHFRTGGKSVQLPCATSAAMPILSPSVGCG